MKSVSELSDMTVNERLYVKGLLTAWDAAVSRKDRDAMIEILGRVELSDQAASIADSVLKRKHNSN
jgi:hypothetical protein